MTNEQIQEKIKEQFSDVILDTPYAPDSAILIIKKDRLHDLMHFLKNEPALHFDMLMDICGVDYSKTSAPSSVRFEVVYQFYSFFFAHRLRLRVQVPEDDLNLPTVIDLWKSADWAERETAEMFGIHFVGHPNLKALLLFEGFEGHPLRKDYPIARRQKIPVPLNRVS